MADSAGRPAPPGGWRRFLSRGLAGAILLWAVAGAGPAGAVDEIAPERATGRQAAQSVVAYDWMVVAAHPLASAAGAAMLREGGTAVDAMIATQLVLGLVEPQSSGLGGGAFLVHWAARDQQLVTLDGRETAPAAATPDLFLGADGQPLGFYDAVVGGRSVGTPGTVRLLAEAHRRWGRLPWDSLFEPAIRLAETGFLVSPRLAALVAQDAARLRRNPATRDYFFDARGAPVRAGMWLTNPAYGQTLRRLALGGEDAFYQGTLAAQMVAAVQQAPDNPGRLALADLAAYRVVERPALCVAYRIYRICGMGPPSSGMLTIGGILGLLQPYHLARLGPADPEAWRLIGDASRLAFADRDRYIADTDFIRVPVKGLLDPAYLAARAALLKGSHALPDSAAEAGSPPWDHAEQRATGAAPELPSTSHLVIRDRVGNLVTMTTTIENGFGARLMVGGFLLNNELTDFSFVPERGGIPVANRVEPGKRPRSSMAPTIVFKDGRPVLALGSPGGALIINVVAKVLIATLDWGLDLKAALALPNLANRGGPYEVETGTPAALVDGLRAKGFAVQVKELNSGVAAVQIFADHMVGAADPRREGLPLGE